jgi:hypothetical protein
MTCNNIKGPFNGKPDFFFYGVFIANKKIIVSSLFNIVPFEFNALVPALDKRLDSAGKKFFWTDAQPLVHRRNLIVVPELHSTQCILQWSEDMKITRRQVG